MAKLVCEDGTLRVYELETNEREFCFTTKEGFAKPEGKWIEIKPEGIATEHNGVLQAFTDAILQGTNLIAKGEEGIKGLMISNAMHLSSWLGKAISLPINEKLFLNELNKKRKTSQKKENIVEAVLDTEGSYGGNHI